MSAAPAERDATSAAGAAAADGEMRRLAHVLGVGAEQLTCVSAVPARDLRALRRQIGEALFRADQATFTRVAALSRLVPTAAAAKLAEHAFPALLAARTAELIDPQRAADIVARLPDHYLADVAAALDPARARAVVAALPPARVARAGAELARRQEWVVIAGFIDHVDAQALRATVAEFDGAQLLCIGFVLDDKARLAEIAAALRDEQVDSVLAEACTHRLWAELDDMLDHLDPAATARISQRYLAAPPDIRASVAKAAATGALRERSLEALAGPA